MLGKIAVLCALVSCAHNVGQDENTGPDGKELGAKPIVLDNNEGKARGIVTYPGGDRTDWKLIELPDKKIGTLDLELQWQPPRPGLQLAFDVFDEYNGPVAQSKKTSKKRSASRVRTASILHARGKYFVRVYAVDRGDAGAYKLTVNFKELLDPKSEPIDIPWPPKLADIPVDCDPFDPKNAACATTCVPEAPPGWKACIGKCVKDDATNPACWPTMKCPANAPDIHIKDCTPSHWLPCDRNNPSNPVNLNNPNCSAPPPPLPPLMGRVMKNELKDGDVLIYVSVAQKVAAEWNIYVLSGDTDKKLAKVIFVRMIDGKTMLGRVHLKPDVVNANLNVRFEPPPP